MGYCTGISTPFALLIGCRTIIWIITTITDWILSMKMGEKERKSPLYIDMVSIGFFGIVTIIIRQFEKSSTCLYYWNKFFTTVYNKTGLYFIIPTDDSNSEKEPNSQRRENVLNVCSSFEERIGKIEKLIEPLNRNIDGLLKRITKNESDLKAILKEESIKKFDSLIERGGISETACIKNHLMEESRNHCEKSNEDRTFTSCSPDVVKSNNRKLTLERLLNLKLPEDLNEVKSPGETIKHHCTKPFHMTGTKARLLNMHRAELNASY